MNNNVLPKIWSTGTVAKLLSTPDDIWSTKRTRRWLIRTGAGVKRGSRWVTTPERLASCFPEILAIISASEAHE